MNLSVSRIFLVLFIVVPAIEIYLLIQVGSLIGAIPTILLILATAMIGVALLRQQGLSTLSRFQNNLSSGALPAQELVEGVLLAVGGALLMTPGFVTDAMGFFCLIPLTRKIFAMYIMKRSAVQMQAGMGGAGFSRSQQGAGFSQQDNIYEGEFVRKDDDRLKHD